MKKSLLRTAIALIAATTFAACDTPEPDPQPLPTPSDDDEEVVAPYGYYTFGQEKIPVCSFMTAEEGYFMLKLSPLEEALDATTYAIIGLHSAFLGQQVDVSRAYHNDDYIFIYEDPVRYFSSYRPLQSGTIFLDRNIAGTVRVKVDVVLYDGTPFSYENASLFPE